MRIYLKKITICLLFVFLLCGIILSTSTVYAANGNSHPATVRKTDYKTTERKPTYTATLNENNKLLKTLEEKINGKDGKKENKILSFTKNYGSDIIDETFAILNGIKDASEGKDTDWEKIGVDLVKNIVVAIASKYGLGTAVSSLFTGLESLLTDGEAPLSEIAVLTDNIYKQFNKMSDQLYDIENQIGELSNDIKQSTIDVLGATSSQINNLDAKQVLRGFMSSGEGNFSYTEYQNYLYGSTKTSNSNKACAYFNQLINAIFLQADDDVIQYYYNKLFEALYSNINTFKEYYFGETSGLDKSIVKYYYDYLSSNKSLLKDGKTSEVMAIEFAYDLYSTYVYSYDLIELCFSYQISQMYIEETLNGKELNDYSKYKYNDDTYIYYHIIKDELNDIASYKAQAEEMAVSDLAYILNMKDSYTTVDPNGSIHNIGNYGTTFGNIAHNQVVYLNQLTDELYDMFELDKDKISYYIDNTKITNRSKYGIIDSNDFTSNICSVSIYYGSTLLYTIDLKLGSLGDFNGGSGSFDDPYLISNKYQFLMIENEMDACYEIISDIDFLGVDLYPIGTYKNPFNGILNGNGYTLSNLQVYSLNYDEKNITLTPTTGLFGTVGENGVLENIEVSNLNILSDYAIDNVSPENDTTAYYIGGLVGFNNGQIYNCVIKDNSGITVKREKTTNESRNVQVYVGGIAGISKKSNGHSTNISYCTVDDLVIDAKSYMDYFNESIETNKNTLLVGGITGSNDSAISNCRVSENVRLSGYAKSTADSSDREKPYITLGVGGITGNEDVRTGLFNVYSQAVINNCRAEVYNDGTYLGSHRFDYDNVTNKSGKYYPVFFWLTNQDTLDEREKNEYLSLYIDELIKYDLNYYEISSSYVIDDKIKESIHEADKNVKKELIRQYNEAEIKGSEVIKDIIIDYNDKCFVVNKNTYDVSIESFNNYQVNTNYIDYNKLTFKVNNNVVDAQIISYYGYDSYNNDINNEKTISVKVFFNTIIEGESIDLQGDVEITITKDEIISKPDIIGIKTNYNLNDNEEAIFNNGGFTITYHYLSGDIEYYINSLSDVEIIDFNTSEYSHNGFIFRIKHQGNLIEQKARVMCNHTNIGTNPINIVAPTCTSLGYEEWLCIDCGCIIQKNYVHGEHSYMVDDLVPATCLETGHTQIVRCNHCGEIFDTGEWIQKLPHKYVTIEEAKIINESNIVEWLFDSKYSPKSYHYCINGQHYEPHQYLVSESLDSFGKLVYTYTCRECGYVYEIIDDNLITDAYMNMPTVFITDGYVLNNGDLVTVYCQLKNNPGYNGANFGIRYSDGLELVTYEEGTIVPKQLKAGLEVYNGYNFLWAGEENIVDNSYLLKLVFKVNSENQETQTVDIVYGHQKITYEDGKIDDVQGGFTTDNSKYGIQKFITHSGKISFVSHLPGDVNNDKIVDNMDAIYLAWGIVGKEGISLKKQYADVNLDGLVNLNDVICILQSISGNFGTNLLDYNYDFNMNLNGYTNNEIDTQIEVSLYNEEGTINSWNDIINFSNYEKEMNRMGYTFDGWWTRLIGGVKIDDISKEVVYDSNLGTQTLYAHWKKNVIRFDLNGGTNEAINDIIYDETKIDENGCYYIELQTPELKHDIEYYLYGDLEYSNTQIYDTNVIYKKFLGWYIEDEKITSFDLALANLNEVVLKAKWEDNYVWDKPKEERQGYTDIEKWYWKPSFSDSFWTGELMTDTVVGYLLSQSNNSLRLYSKPSYIEYSIIYNGLEGILNTNSDKFTLATGVTISGDCIGTKEGWKFNGWNDSKQKNITINYLNISSYATNNIVIMNATWVPEQYTIVYNANSGIGTMEDTIVTYNENKALSKNTFTKEGYSFIGWSYSSNGTVKHSDGDTVKNLLNTSSGKVTLFAIWSPNEYTIMYNANGGNGFMENSIATYDKKILLSKNIFVKEGYAFAGWATTTNGSIKYYDNESVKNLIDTPDDCITLYAIWNGIVNNYLVNTKSLSCAKDNGYNYDKPDVNANNNHYSHNFEFGKFLVKNCYKSSNNYLLTQPNGASLYFKMNYASTNLPLQDNMTSRSVSNDGTFNNLYNMPSGIGSQRIGYGLLVVNIVYDDGTQEAPIYKNDLFLNKAAGDEIYICNISKPCTIYISICYELVMWAPGFMGIVDDYWMNWRINQGFKFN